MEAQIRQSLSLQLPHGTWMFMFAHVLKFSTLFKGIIMHIHMYFLIFFSISFNFKNYFFMAGELEAQIFKRQSQIYRVQMSLPKSPMLLIAYYHFPLQLQVFLQLLQYIVKQERDLHLVRVTLLIMPKVIKIP